MILLGELQRAQPLATLPEVARVGVLRGLLHHAHHHPQWVAVIGIEWLAVELRCQQRCRAQHVGEIKICAKAMLAVLDHEVGCRLELNNALINQILHPYTLPRGVEFAPARHAMDIHGDLAHRQFLELLPRKAHFLLHFAKYTKVPLAQVIAWHRPIVQYGKALG